MKYFSDEAIFHISGSVNRQTVTVQFGGQSHPMKTMNIFAAAQGSVILICFQEHMNKSLILIIVRIWATNGANIEKYQTPKLYSLPLSQ